MPDGMACHPDRGAARGVGWHVRRKGNAMSASSRLASIAVMLVLGLPVPDRVGACVVDQSQTDFGGTGGGYTIASDRQIVAQIHARDVGHDLPGIRPRERPSGKGM
jgi:hypothetical protein